MTLSNNAVTHAVSFTLVLYDPLQAGSSSRVIGVAKKGARESVCVWLCVRVCVYGVAFGGLHMWCNCSQDRIYGGYVAANSFACEKKEEGFF